MEPFNHNFEPWSKQRTSEANWKKPLSWNNAAEKAGIRTKVFCASLADVFDDEVPDQWRADLFTLINQTPNLDWLLLTKRPQNIMPMLDAIRYGNDEDYPLSADMPLPNVWFGTTVENQKAADERIPVLLQVPAVVRFLSVEPMLGPVDLEPWLYYEDEMYKVYPDCGKSFSNLISWVICGGESGPGARPMHPDWARDLRDQCVTAGVPFLFKQWGEWAPAHDLHATQPEFKGKVWHSFDPDTSVCKVGKHRAGRLLDGRTWDEFPTPETP